MSAASGPFLTNLPARGVRVYLDHAASTPVDPEAHARVQRVSAIAGNPASVHAAGVEATREVERARSRIAGVIGCEPDELLFTSGATEANNLALKGVVLGQRGRVPHLLVSAVEHPSVTEPARWLAEAGFARLTMLPVDGEGRLRPEALADALDADAVLVSVQHANNETGVLQDLSSLARVCRRAGVLLHVDASQSLCKAPLDVRALGIDLLTASGHKLHGPKGVGILYVREGVPLVPLLHGGGHERGLRGGTLNAPGIAGFGEAVVRYSAADREYIAGLQRYFEAGLRTRFPDVRIHGEAAPRVANITNFALPGRGGKALFLDLDRRGILVSASSACHSTLLTPSPVLIAMGYTEAEANEALRVSFGRGTTAAELDALLVTLTELTEGVVPCP